MSATGTRPSSSVTNTVTLENLASGQSQSLVLRLNRRKKKVTWKEGTVDNELMQKKSSKKCCIFHKDKPFDEDTSDDDDHDHNHHHDHDSKDAVVSSSTAA
ncbi:hypothetical protein LWI28_013014 [Acer negundo]|uniref:Protein phosphatase 1 regulatory subunit 11 n=1 Tax=Acer negundo TaxID=4023 RepID=A0AAD5JTL0_ACENE|nr:hypothetical protein LWI28_013014 [Acer negundo]KAK4860312.1 hypothetical protein QYF36_021069 [Acer negundo]